MPFEQGAEHQETVERLLLRFGLHRSEHSDDAGVLAVAAVGPATVLDKIREPSDDLADVVAALMARLAVWGAKAVPVCYNNTIDPRADPKYFNDSWTPWLGL